MPTHAPFFALLLAACAADPGAPSLARRLDDLAVCEPTDLVVLLPWTGPAFDPATGVLLAPLPAGHVEAVVNGWPDPADAAVALRMERGAELAADVFARDGLLGFQGVESRECGISMSHTLWRDEAAMVAFVTAAPHATAMADADAMLLESAGAHWTGDARTVAPTWQDGVARLVDELR